MSKTLGHLYAALLANNNAGTVTEATKIMNRIIPDIPKNGPSAEFNIKIGQNRTFLVKNGTFLVNNRKVISKLFGRKSNFFDQKSNRFGQKSVKSQYYRG